MNKFMVKTSLSYLRSERRRNRRGYNSRGHNKTQCIHGTLSLLSHKNGPCCREQDTCKLCEHNCVDHRAKKSRGCREDKRTLSDASETFGKTTFWRSPTGVMPLNQYLEKTCKKYQNHGSDLFRDACTIYLAVQLNGHQEWLQSTVN